MAEKAAEKAATRIALREGIVEEARKFNLLSDVFVAVALDDVPACQHVLRILTGISDLVIKEITTQYRISKITSRDGILDILAEDGAGQLYNVEIQRSETLDHARRTRFYGSIVDSEFLLKGQSYEQMPEVRIYYISETDIWRNGKTVYHVRKSFEGSDLRYDDGMHVTYINAAVDDGSEIARLMQYFKTADPEDMSQGALSERVHFLKSEEGGRETMCKITEKIWQEGRQSGIAEGRQSGIQEGRQEQAWTAVVNLSKMGLPVEKIAEVLEVNAGLVKQWLEAGKTMA